MPRRDPQPAPELLEFVERFNAREFEASHEALVAAWAKSRGNDFYKGLIQLAGAFQHWASKNAFWAEDLFASAHNLLEKYAPRHEGLDVAALVEAIRRCHEVAKQARLAGSVEPFEGRMPQLRITLVPR